MSDYKALYFEMFNKISDIIEDLKDLQKTCEEKIIECENNEKAED